MRRPAGSLQRNQGAKAVPHQHGFFQTCSGHQREDEIGRFFHRDRRIPCAAAVAGQIHSEHVPAVVGEVATLQNPDAVVIQHAMDEDKGGLGGIKRLAAGVAIGAVAVHVEIHVFSS